MLYAIESFCKVYRDIIEKKELLITRWQQHDILISSFLRVISILYLSWR